MQRKDWVDIFYPFYSLYRCFRVIIIHAQQTLWYLCYQPRPGKSAHDSMPRLTLVWRACKQSHCIADIYLWPVLSWNPIMN